MNAADIKTSRDKEILAALGLLLTVVLVGAVMTFVVYFAVRQL